MGGVILPEVMRFGFGTWPELFWLPYPWDLAEWRLNALRGPN